MVLRFGVLLATLAVGCSEHPAITVTETAAVAPRTAPPDPARLAETLDHMFAAIVPAGKQAWFFKLVAPGAAADDARQPFKDFLATVSVDEGADRPTWTLPADWKETLGGQMRFATITMPHPQGPLEITVSSLPFDEDWAPFVSRNVNRWMGQLQEAPLDDETIGKLAKSVPAKSGEATCFELVGVMAKKSPMMPAGHPPVGASAESSAPKAPAATQQAAAPGPAADAEFDYKLPAGWRVGPGNPMRKATFLVGEGDTAAEVSVTAFPAMAAMADPVENARRWAAMAGESNLTDDQLKKKIGEIKISGEPGQVMEFLGAGASRTAIAAGMLRRGELVWFFKLQGPRKTVEANRQALRDLLASVKFRD